MPLLTGHLTCRTGRLCMLLTTLDVTVTHLRRMMAPPLSQPRRGGVTSFFAVFSVLDAGFFSPAALPTCPCQWCAFWGDL